MEKFTIRDFLVFFSTGLIGVSFYYILHQSIVNDFLVKNKENLKEINSFYYFATIPILYVLGHLIQAIEDIFYLIGKYVSIATNKYKIFTPLNFLLNGHRVQNVFYKNNVEARDFWRMCSRVQLRNQYGFAEYWYVMSDFFKSLYALTICFVLYSIWWCDIKITILFFVIATLTWYRSKVFSHYFVRTILDTNHVIVESENMKSN